MKINGLQVMQFLAMIVMPAIIFGNVKPDGDATVWSYVVVALLFVGISLCAIANAVSERGKPTRQL